MKLLPSLLSSWLNFSSWAFLFLYHFSFLPLFCHYLHSFLFCFTTFSIVSSHHHVALICLQVPFVRPHTESQALIKQDLISVLIDSTSASKSGQDSKVEELMLSSKDFLYFSWNSDFCNFQTHLFGGELCCFLICFLNFIPETNSLCWVTHSLFPIIFTFWTCFRSLCFAKI